MSLSCTISEILSVIFSYPPFTETMHIFTVSETARYWPQIAIFKLSHLHWRPLSG